MAVPLSSKRGTLLHQIFYSRLVDFKIKFVPPLAGDHRSAPTIAGVNFSFYFNFIFFNNKSNNMVTDATPAKTQVIKITINNLFPAWSNLLPKLNHKLKQLIIVKIHKIIIVFLFSNIFTLSPILIFC